MNIELSLNFKEDYNCFDNLIVQVAKYWNKDYELMSLGAWEFSYNNLESESNAALGARIKDDIGTRLDYLADYHGMKVIGNQKKDPDEILSHIKSELSNQRPVAIYVDAFWCPWYTSDYQKEHSDHFCLAIGFDSSNNNIYIVDSQFATNGANLPFEIFKHGYGDYCTFQNIEIKNKNVDWKALILDSIRNLKEPSRPLNAFEQMRQFAEDIHHKLNFENEIRGYEESPFTAPIFKTIVNISRKRKQYGIALSYIAKKHDIMELELVAKQMKTIGDRWLSSFGLLSKAYFMNSDPRLIKRLSVRINDLANDEERIFENLKELCDFNTMHLSEETVLSSIDHDRSRIAGYTFLNLEEYVNNKGFGDTLDQNCIAELSNGGRYFLTEGLPSEDIWNIDNMAFRVLMLNSNICDNIACMGQEIIVNQECHDYIMFLGCSELGDHSEHVEIEYSDGNIEKLPLEFTNWAKPEANYNEIKAWTGKGAERSDDRVIVYPFETCIYAKNYKLKWNKFIKNIKLPTCPNIHVFAITFGRN